MKITALFIFVFASYLSFSQIVDDFSDGNFTQNPTWNGNDSSFKINIYNTLQLNSTGSDTAYLSTPNAVLSNTEWRFYIKQSFNSSSNNHSRIYLVSDKQNLKKALKGYFVQFGSTQDNISLYRQDSLSTTPIITGIHGFTGNTTNEFTIKVTRNSNGVWELFSDASAGNAFISEGQAIDSSYKSTSYFGIFCKFTSSNSTKFYFDNFYVGTIQVDSFPPKIKKVTVLSSNSLAVYFDEAITQISANNISNYSVNISIGNPISALQDISNPLKVVLTFQSNFLQSQSYILSINNIEDLNGNILISSQIPFIFYLPKAFDVQINEILADPTPLVALPDKEYIELYNRTAFDINLHNWTFTLDNTYEVFPDSVIKSNSYIILCNSNDIATYQAYGSVIGLSSFSLLNSGQQLILKNEIGNIIHSIKYNINWFGQSSKKDGGWSLEQIDPQNPCGCQSNWWPSNDSKGGTPGKKNSVFAFNPDIAAPDIDRIEVIDSLNISIVFSEPMDSSSINKTSAYQIFDLIGYPLNAVPNYPTYQSVRLILAKPLKTSILYKLQVKDTLRDCIGNTISLNAVKAFGMSEMPLPNDLVINEILYNPKDNGVDFVEIYNRSEKIINLKGLKLANYSFDISDFSSVSEISATAFSIFPGEYFVLTTDPTMVKKQYYTKNSKNFVAMSSFPSMSNTSGNIYLITSSLMVLDSIYYFEAAQYPILKSVEGVSMERINFDLPSTTDNWHSASESVGFASPAYKNSQFSTVLLPSGEFTLSPEIFSPDNDGFNDFLSINYKLNVGTIISKIIAYDSKGKQIKSIVSNYLAASEGVINWDGTTDDNQKASIGIYVIYIEIFNLQGNVSSFKKVATLGGKL
ncbi:MAG: hypothetical protein AUJ98_01260 [Bacteroidetes bacterium CG2_30_33_31]|nr:MAG: hypothetical protein AUJ98_01260 [Bacteroidetes bacterium CG2_30_33_31]